MVEPLSPNRPVASATGGLAKTPFLHVLVYALERQLTGTLALSAPGGAAATVFFARGMPAKAWTSEPIADLALLRRELGYPSPMNDAELRHAFRTMTLRRMRHMAGFPHETTFAYFDRYDAVRADGVADGLQLDPLPFISAEVRRAPSWKHVHTVLTRVASATLRISRKADLTRLELRDDELRAVERLRTRALRISEFTSAEGLAVHEAERLLYCLLISKQVEPLFEAPGGGPPMRPRLYTDPDWASARPSNEPPVPSSRQNSVPQGSPPASSGSFRAAAHAPDLSAGLASRRAEVLERVLRIEKENYFEMLGVDVDTPPETLQHVFFALAKVWHPDRLPPALADVREACSRVFARMSEAYQTLSDPEQRERYRVLYIEGGTAPAAQDEVARVVDAVGAFQRAELFFKRSDFAQAESFCRAAHDADRSQPDYLALLAWLEAQRPENQAPRATQERIRMLDRALEQNPRCERAYFDRGMLHKRMRNMSAAMRDFRDVVDLNPHNIDAAREVRIYEMRRSNPGFTPPTKKAQSDSEKPGLFRRLFKK